MAGDLIFDEQTGMWKVKGSQEEDWGFGPEQEYDWQQQYEKFAYDESWMEENENEIVED